MNCHEAASRIERHVDGELGMFERRSFERHMRDCPKCAAQRAQLVDLQGRIRAEAPHYAAPAALRARMESLLASHTAAQPRARKSQPWMWLTAGAASGCVATLLGIYVATHVIDWQRSQDVVAEVVASHVRATLADHRIQVASSDQHTVKPWLSERLDYSPPVRDLAADGYPLIGARIDSLDGRRVATLVYQRRLHWIDVFVVPASERAHDVREQSVRGWNIVRRSAADMDWIFVSDLASDELTAFADELATRVAGP
ncbi:MAG TPA: zf-HC2 domain-containing protein [Casimicrobiaceae bacterium]|nr:zf-HC2 domain-containing protein [Casimicrobiaceae bacterium]